MTENVCYSILKIAIQQIIQSAGFEGANNSSIETLTDVLQKYLQALGRSVSEYAQLNGRTTGNAFDVLDALQEFSMEPRTLKHWLEEEGKSLTPCWSENSDPGRLIEGIVSDGRPDFNDIIEYNYAQYDEYDIFDEEEAQQDSVIHPSSIQQTETNNDLPNYIPKYFPPFPVTESQDEDEMMQEANNATSAAAKAKAAAAAQAAVELQKQKELQDKQNKEKENFPILVKNRKKPIDNPFTHIIPFEDSSLSLLTSTTSKQDAAEQGSPPISLALIEEENSSMESHNRTISTSIEESQAAEKSQRVVENDKQEEYTVKRRKLDIETLSSVINNIKEESNQLDGKKDGIIQNNSNELFKTQTENAAAPGNYLFNKDSGVFDQVILSISDPMVLSKLTTPNLHTDIALSNNYSTTPLATPTTLHHGNNMFNNRSMLQSLANGNNALASNANKLKRLNQPIPTINTLSKHSVDINAIKTGDSKYIIKKKKMLAEKERLAQLERDREAARERGELIEEMDVDGGTPAPLPPVSIPVEKIDGDNSGTTKLNGHSGNGSSSSSSNFESSGTNNATSSSKPIAATPASASIKASSGPRSLSSLMSATSPPPATGRKEKSEKKEKKEKKKKDKSGANLTVTLSSTEPTANLNEATSASSTTSSPNTTKIRLKLSSDQSTSNGHKSSSAASSNAGGTKLRISTSDKPKIPKSKSATTSTPYKSPNMNMPTATTPTTIKLEQQPQTLLSLSRPTQSSPLTATAVTTEPTDEIKCICENPTVDYGFFMIACDMCGVWFHGSCVDLLEETAPEHWNCHRCKRQ